MAEKDPLFGHFAIFQTRPRRKSGSNPADLADSIHTLNLGDQITLTTQLGTRTYSVTSVSKVIETDTSGTAATSDNQITLYTCDRDQSAYRWCVVAQEV